MIDVKRQIDGLYPTIRSFEGNPAIRLLPFLSQLRDAFNMAGASEASAVHVLSYFLTGEDRYVLSGNFEASEDDFEDPVRGNTGTCSDVCHALISWFLTDYVLRQAHDSVARDTQDAR